MLQMGDTVGPRYTAPKISVISYLFRTFSLLIITVYQRTPDIAISEVSEC